MRGGGRLALLHLPNERIGATLESLDVLVSMALDVRQKRFRTRHARRRLDRALHPIEQGPELGADVGTNGVVALRAALGGRRSVDLPGALTVRALDPAHVALECALGFERRADPLDLVADPARCSEAHRAGLARLGTFGGDGVPQLLEYPLAEHLDALADRESLGTATGSRRFERGLAIRARLSHLRPQICKKLTLLASLFARDLRHELLALPARRGRTERGHVRRLFRKGRPSRQTAGADGRLFTLPGRAGRILCAQTK